MLSNLKTEFLAPLAVQGAPAEADLARLDSLADAVAARHAAAGLR